MKSTDDLHIAAMKELLSPEQLHQAIPIGEKAAETEFNARRALQNILHGRDDRVFVVVGPCSIHDPEAAMEYAHRLTKPMQALREDLCIVMRVYFQKPRTTVGWKGLINDPYLDGSFQINEGLHRARR